MKVLVVEDEAALSQQLAGAFRTAGYAVDSAADGERGDFLARTESYDAVILDLGLPSVDGLTLLRSWRAAGLQVPVVKAVTTFGTAGVSVIAVSHRRTGYFAAHLDGEQVPRLNGQPLGRDPVLLSNHDVLELAGTKMEFLLGA